MTNERADGERFDLAVRPLAPWFERRVITVAPGQARRYAKADWRDALVVVARGEIELEPTRGCPCRFVRGDVLWFEDLPLRAVHNRGAEQAVLIAISRRWCRITDDVLANGSFHARHGPI